MCFMMFSHWTRHRRRKELRGPPASEYAASEQGACSVGKEVQSAEIEVCLCVSRDYTNPYLPVAPASADPNLVLGIQAPIPGNPNEGNVLLCQVCIPFRSQYMNTSSTFHLLHLCICPDLSSFLCWAVARLPIPLAENDHAYVCTQIENQAYPVNVDALNTVFSPYGFVQKIAIFEKNGQTQVPETFLYRSFIIQCLVCAVKLQPCLQSTYFSLLTPCRRPWCSTQIQPAQAMPSKRLRGMLFTMEATTG